MKQRSALPTIIAAAESGDVKALKAILEEKPHSINTKSELGDTAIHVAAAQNQKEVVRLLIAKGAKINAKGNQGQTPLHVAAENGASGVVELLLKHGARTNTRDDRGNTVLQVAAICKRVGVPETEKTLRLIKNACPDIDLRTAIMINDWEGVATLLEKDPQLVETESRKVGLVALAIRREVNPNIIQLLLEHGADPNAPLVAGHKDPPITMVSNPQIAELLLRFGADHTRTNHQGFTALRIARKYKMKALEDVLRKHGAKVTRSNKSSRTGAKSKEVAPVKQQRTFDQIRPKLDQAVWDQLIPLVPSDWTGLRLTVSYEPLDKGRFNMPHLIRGVERNEPFKNDARIDLDLLYGVTYEHLKAHIKAKRPWKEACFTVVRTPSGTWDCSSTFTFSDG